MQQYSNLLVHNTVQLRLTYYEQVFLIHYKEPGHVVKHFRIVLAFIQVYFRLMPFFPQVMMLNFRFPSITFSRATLLM